MSAAAGPPGEPLASAPPPPPPPPEGTVEAWAHAYVTSDSFAYKLAPPPRPREWESAAPARRLVGPGRPASATTAPRANTKNPSPEALRDPAKRAELFHTFLHHELQAAELMCWALLAFPDAPPAFRRGLLGICDDEIRHMRMYGERMAGLGLAFGARRTNDWFWQRVPTAPSAAHFVAGMGIGFEGGNLDHATRFADRFRQAGDAEGAEVQARVAREEVPHVAFGVHWFRALTGADAIDFDAWARYLPEPLSPTVMHGAPVNREARLRAGLSEAFLDRLARS